MSSLLFKCANKFTDGNVKFNVLYLGGGNQLLFGLKGKRWDEHELLSKYYNEHWVRPLAHEVPKNNTLVEGGCYW